MNGCEYGPPDDVCGRTSCRQVAGKKICHSHRRKWLAGKPLDQPVRGYQRYEEGPDGKVTPIRAKARRPAPFQAEMKLLRDLGLR